ncbi:TonB family protein [Ancylomarina euxinus]|uniref:TonB family protein n=1 Tax=Ancylomarina euxinus TaxID=2283627 RepID=A0A425Y8K0_9BACT|nr:energy transducer TonB [Ancylomarina euxinus]MCZ4693269.1 TonB family protein [Ancylomarina euxinus]MUP13496.1 TonB family protein [Ancylomarina euxinus]RRG24879.1 TonB family protein [Ancylomarina euxinus]
MEIKKTKKADLENKRGLFLEIGLVLTLALVFFAFEWRVDSHEIRELNDVQELEVDNEIIPITREPINTPPPPPPAPKLADILIIVDDNEDIDEELIIEEAIVDIDEDVKVQVNEDIEVNDEPQIFMVVEEMPKFPGGDLELLRWINNSVKYPVIAQENGITGRVHMNFVINETGGIENIVVVRGVDPSLDKEAVRVIKKMPKWKPGKQRGKAVKVSFSLPINFQLQ